jgi:hypothetical protein
VKRPPSPELPGGDARRTILDGVSSPDKPPPVPDDSDLTPEEEDEILRRAEEAEKNVREGNVIPWEALFPPRRLTG